jgi:hypothetical protein
MRPVTMEVGWPSTGERWMGWDWANEDERRKERGERRREKYKYHFFMDDMSGSRSKITKK